MASEGLRTLAFAYADLEAGSFEELKTSTKVFTDFSTS